MHMNYSLLKKAVIITIYNIIYSLPCSKPVLTKT